MEIQRTGVILNTGKYEECVAFYRDLFDLPVMFTKAEGDFRLTCFDFGGSYLMIETGGRGSASGKGVEVCPHKLRFNVRDIDAALRKVRAFGIAAEIEAHDWGRVIHLHDPDGNRVGIRDEAGFMVE